MALTPLKRGAWLAGLEQPATTTKLQRLDSVEGAPAADSGGSTTVRVRLPSARGRTLDVRIQCSATVGALRAWLASELQSPGELRLRMPLTGQLLIDDAATIAATGLSCAVVHVEHTGAQLAATPPHSPLSVPGEAAATAAVADEMEPLQWASQYDTHHYGLGKLDLLGLLTHPHLGVAVVEYMGGDTRAATALRGVCRKLRGAVAAHAWHDTLTRVVWPGRWRRAFPLATAASVQPNGCGWVHQLTDADFVHFWGIHTLNMRGCSQATITDAAFVHLRGIRELDMSGCNQATITDAAFAHLAGVHTLHMTGCNQATITDAAFAHLRGIHELDMWNCNQATITDAAFVHLRGIRELDMSGCNQATITDAVFAHLAGVHTLHMNQCTQSTITDAAFVHLAGVHTLNMRCCKQATISDAAFTHLSGIHTLDMSYCSQAGITDAAFAHLAGIHTLDMSNCSQATITDAAFTHLAGIHTLNMWGCYQSTITEACRKRLQPEEDDHDHDLRMWLRSVRAG